MYLLRIEDIDENEFNMTISEIFQHYHEDPILCLSKIAVKYYYLKEMKTKTLEEIDEHFSNIENYFLHISYEYKEMI